jgi:hypothetical protein
MAFEATTNKGVACARPRVKLSGVALALSL